MDYLQHQHDRNCLNIIADRFTEVVDDMVDILGAVNAF